MTAPPPAPIPQPLLNLMQGVLHTNVSSNWRRELMQWQVNNSDKLPVLREQIARYALTDAMDPALLARASGTVVANEYQVREWFTAVYQALYGNRPEFDFPNS